MSGDDRPAVLPSRHLGRQIYPCQGHQILPPRCKGRGETRNGIAGGFCCSVVLWSCWLCPTDFCVHIRRTHTAYDDIHSVHWSGTATSMSAVVFGLDAIECNSVHRSPDKATFVRREEVAGSEPCLPVSQQYSVHEGQERNRQRSMYEVRGRSILLVSPAPRYHVAANPTLMQTLSSVTYCPFLFFSIIFFSLFSPPGGLSPRPRETRSTRTVRAPEQPTMLAGESNGDQHRQLLI